MTAILHAQAHRHFALLGFILVGAAALAVCMPDTAGADDFYRARSINLIVGFNPGGGADTLARVIARHFGKHIAGGPTLVVRNMQGAGSMNAANYLYNLAPRDGSEIGMFSGHVATDPAISEGTYKFSALKFNWIGAPASAVNVCIASPIAGIQTLRDVQSRDMIVGTTGTTNNSTYDFPVILNNVIGTRFKLIKGYAGSAALNLAMGRGEIEGFCGVGYDFLRGAGLTGDRSKVLVQFGLSKSPHMPDVPFVMDFAKTDDDLRIFRLVFGWLNFERVIAAPPGISADRLAELRQAFDATVKDPDFLSDAQNAQIDIDPMSGDEITSFLVDAYRTPSAIAVRAAEYLDRTPIGASAAKPR